MKDLYRNLEFDVIIEEIAKLCYFSGGSDVINNMTMVNNRILVQRQLAETSEALAMLNLAQEYDLGGTFNIGNAVTMATKDQIVAPLDLVNIAKQNNAVKMIVQKLNNSEVKTEALMELASTMQAFDDVAKHIYDAINEYGEIREDASSELRRLKREEQNLSKSFAVTINNYLQNNKVHLAEAIASERNNRSVVLVNNTFKNTLKGVIHGESNSGLSVYFEPESFITSNNRRLSLINLIDEEIERILYGLSQAVKAIADLLTTNLTTLALLDAILAKAKWGYQREAIIAQISDDRSLSLKQIAHPLIERKKVVRNTYQIASNGVLIISGPNTGGKTVTLKTIGLSVLMTLAGIPILAEEAKIPLVDNIFVDLGDAQSVMASLSTFSSHLTTLARITKHATSKSLILLDELGGGTDPKEGEALAIAVIEYLHELQAIVVVTTHLTALKKYAQADTAAILASVEFNEETLTPTYRYFEGLAGQSNALEIAAKFDFPKVIINNANQLKEKLLSEEEKLMASLEKQERSLMKQAEQLAVQEQEVAQLQQQLQDANEALDKQRQMIIDKATDEANKLIKDKQDEMQVLFDEMQELRNFSKLHQVISVKKKADDLTESTKTNALTTDRDVVVGDLVKVAGMNHHGELISINGKNANVVINGINISTKLNKLSYFGQREMTKKSAAIKVSAKKMSSSELNVIGLTINEAIPLVEKFIDEGIVVRAPYLRIVHGSGSGVLRNAIHKLLSKNKNVKEYQLAPPAQGGAGATIVRFVS